MGQWGGGAGEGGEEVSFEVERGGRRVGLYIGT